jgi:hypothetical protein
MSAFVKYDASGAIVGLGTCPDDMLASQPVDSGQTLLAIDKFPVALLAYIQQNYVAAGVVTAKAAMTASADATTITADGVAAATISALPDPCVVSISGALTADPTPVTGGSIILTCDHPGALLVSVTADPAWLPWSITIDAV